MSKNKITIQLNRFGPYIEEAEQVELLTKLRHKKNNSAIRRLEQFLGISPTEDHLKRYLEITTKRTHLNITPANRKIFCRIIDPLICAKKYYCLSEYISCIAMCGLAGEMLAILIWKISEIAIQGLKISQEEEKEIFGKNFEKLGQGNRISILKVLTIITPDAWDRFNEIRIIRNKYLHLWEYDEKQQKGDAKKCIISALILFKNITNIQLKTFKGEQFISINPSLLKYFNSLE